MSHQPTTRDIQLDKVERDAPPKRVPRVYTSKADFSNIPAGDIKPSSIRKIHEFPIPRFITLPAPPSKDLEVGDPVGWKSSLNQRRRLLWKSYGTPCVLLLVVIVAVIVGVFLIPRAIEENKESRKAACITALDTQDTYVINKLHCKPP